MKIKGRVEITLAFDVEVEDDGERDLTDQLIEKVENDLIGRHLADNIDRTSATVENASEILGEEVE